MFAIRRGEAQADAQIGQIGMRVMPTVKFGDRFGIAFSGFGPDQNAFLEMCLELALQRDEERSAIVTMPIGEAARHDLGVVDLNLHLRVARQRGIHRIEQQALRLRTGATKHAGRGSVARGSALS